MWTRSRWRVPAGVCRAAHTGVDTGAFPESESSCANSSPCGGAAGYCLLGCGSLSSWAGDRIGYKLGALAGAQGGLPGFTVSVSWPTAILEPGASVPILLPGTIWARLGNPHGVEAEPSSWRWYRSWLKFLPGVVNLSRNVIKWYLQNYIIDLSWVMTTLSGVSIQETQGKKMALSLCCRVNECMVSWRKISTDSHVL